MKQGCIHGRSDLDHIVQVSVPMTVLIRIDNEHYTVQKSELRNLNYYLFFLFSVWPSVQFHNGGEDVYIRDRLRPQCCFLQL